MNRTGPVVVHGVELDLSHPSGRARLAELKAAVIRLRNYGGDLSVIADKLGLSETDAEFLLKTGIRDLVADDAEAVRARQQATLNDIRRAMYPAMEEGDVPSAGVLLKVLDHESDLHGLKAPTRVRVGMDQETFTTRVEEDVRALGLHPQMDVPLEEGDDGWANT